MSPCNDFIPTHQAQLEYRWGGRYGGSNCQACAAGEVGQAHTCGAMLFTGAQIRAATNEPIPDPASPGLTLTQVHSALYNLSHGKIDLDVHYGYPFDAFRKRVTEGAIAILDGARKALIDAGQGYGNGFARNHAIAVGATDGKPWFDDPLTGRHPTTWATLERFAGTLDLGDRLLGNGLVYAAFSRDISTSYEVHVPAGTRYVRYVVAVVNGDRKIVDHGWFVTHTGFTAPCTSAKQVLRETINERVRLVKITMPDHSHYLDGVWVAAKFEREV